MAFTWCVLPSKYVEAEPKFSDIRDEVVSEMTKQRLEKIYDYPYIVGEKDNDLKVWPLSRQEVTGVHLVGYVFESIDFSVIPGFMGIPYNLLIAMDLKGKFIDARVIYHREPMFVAGIGEQPMLDFIAQYQGLSLMQNIKFSDKRGKKKSDNRNIYLAMDGVSGATASVRILNQTLLASSLKVARAKLGFGGSKDPDLIAKIDTEIFEERTWQSLIDQDLIARYVFSNKEVNDLFKGTSFERRESLSLDDSEGTYIDIYVMDLTIPTVGKNLLTEESWQFLQEDINGNDHALLVVSEGGYSFIADNFIRGSIPDRLILRQSGLPIEMRDIDFNDRLDLLDPPYKIKLPPALAQADWMVFKVIGPSGLDIASPLEFNLSITRGDGEAYLTPVTKAVSFQYSVPKNYYFEPESGHKTWHSIWSERLVDIIILSLSLVVLSIVLARYQWLSRQAKYFAIFRFSFLVFCFFFIGWYAQAQLSIVNITGAIQSLMAGGGLNFFLYDPMTTLLWIFVIATFFVWGRGTFCGWLCPFGALQELVSKVMSWVKIPHYTVSVAWDSRLKKAKYVVLALILAAAFFSPIWTDRLVEIEPFKTSITFFFDRSWPFVAWAVFLVVLSGFVYKGYCRYLCPLGASMVIFGRLRSISWLPRRYECGKPCQLCKHTCQYQSINKAGTVDYDECFQCLDCVVIYENDSLCAPLIIEERNKKIKQQAIIAKEAAGVSFAGGLSEHQSQSTQSDLVKEADKNSLRGDYPRWTKSGL